MWFTRLVPGAMLLVSAIAWCGEKTPAGATLGALIADLRSADEDARAVALKRLAEKSGAEGVPALVDVAKDKAARRASRKAALYVLEQIGEKAKDAAFDLIAIASGQEESFQAGSWEALATLLSGDPELATQLFLPLREHADKMVKKKIDEILGNYGNALLPVLAKNWKVRQGENLREVLSTLIVDFCEGRLKPKADAGNSPMHYSCVLPWLRSAGGTASAGVVLVQEFYVGEKPKIIFRSSPSTAVRMVTGFLLGKDLNYQIAAIKYLGEMGKDARESLPFLEILVEDPADDVKSAAQEAIRKIKGED